MSDIVDRLRSIDGASRRKDGSQIPLGHDLIEAADEILSLRARIEELERALEPSGETKAAYHGEFAFDLYEGESGAGIDQYRKVHVPWDTVKQIMAAIRARAAIGKEKP